MKLTTLRNSVPLVVAAVIGGLVSQAVPLSMQLHGQTNTAASTTTTATTPPATTKTRTYGVIDTTPLKTDQDIANALSNAAGEGWSFRGSVGSFIILSKKGN
jgi:hypothetical protein